MSSSLIKNISWVNPRVLDILNEIKESNGNIKELINTDNLVKVKKAAKGEFTYALSKNLLKTISNLSL